MTNKIYGSNGSFGRIGELGATQKPKAAKANAQEKAGDTVEFSAVLQQVGQAKNVQGAADTQRVDKVQALKAQVEQGTYNPDLDKVAASLLKFMVEEG